MRPRPPTNPDALVAYRIRELRDKFVYPDEIGGGGGALGEGKGGMFTIAIAAYNATDISKSKADYICTGVNDQDVINSALLELDDVAGSGEAGGRIVFSEGDFHITVAVIGISFSGSSGQKSFELVGVGARGGGQATTFILDAASGSNQRILDTNNQGSTTIRNIAFNGNGNGASCAGILSLFGGGITTYDCTFLSLRNGVLSDVAADQATRIYDSYFDNCTTAISASHGAHIIGNHIEDCTGTASFDAGINAPGGTSAAGPQTIIKNNTVINGDNYGIITGGLVLCEGNHIHNNADSGIFIDSNGGKYLYNTINASGLHGIETSLSNDTKGALIQSNRIYNPQRHGMFIDMPNFQILDNVIVGAGQATVNTYDGINIDHNDAYVSGNSIVSAAGRSRYGINVASGICNIVVGNDIGPVADYGTDNLNNAGTDTRLFWPNDPSIGDNFGGCYGS